MKKTLIISSIIIVILIFGSTYFIFQNKLTATKFEVEKQNKQIKNYFLNETETYTNEFVKLFPEEKEVILKFCSFQKASYLEDTLISFFVFSKKIEKIKLYQNYFDCLFDKCQNEIANIKTNYIIQTKISELQGRYTNQTNDWYSQLDSTLFYNIDSNITACSEIYKKNYIFTVNNLALKEFELFLEQYKINLNKANQQNEIVKKTYTSAYNKYKNKFNSSGRLILSQRATETKMVSSDEINYSFKSELLGDINYTITSVKFNETLFNSVIDNISHEQYKNNSLNNGAKPYAYCFGSYNGCSNGCSQIRIEASNNSDVLVTIKNSSAKVVRHAYIKAGKSYTFNVPNGKYQPFFYYGKGWNPNKFMKTTSCGDLRGGFISNENFGKDYAQNLYNNILTYTLILQQNGNFSTKPSSKNEAF